MLAQPILFAAFALLPFCRDDSVAPPPLPHDACPDIGFTNSNGTSSASAEEPGSVHGSAHPRLCQGLVMIRQAKCAQLESLNFMIEAVHTIGLVPDEIGRAHV